MERILSMREKIIYVKLFYKLTLCEQSGFFVIFFFTVFDF